jgi:hypothetical protein
VSDEDLDVTIGQVLKLRMLFLEQQEEFVDTLLGDSVVIKSSVLASRLSEVMTWSTNIFPQFDLTGKPEKSRFNFRNLESVYIVNQSRTSIFLTDQVAQGCSNVYIVNCSEVTIYLAEAAKNVSIFGCVDSEIVLMGVTGSVILSFSERVTLRSVSTYVRLDNATDCCAYIYCMKGTVMTGDTRGIELGPFNVHFSRHEGLLGITGLLADASHATLWSQPINATLTDQPYVLIAPSKFNLVRFPEFSPIPSGRFAIHLPQIYAEAVEGKKQMLVKLRSEIASIPDETNISKVNSIISGHFREWITTNNKTKSIVEIVRFGDNKS